MRNDPRTLKRSALLLIAVAAAATGIRAQDAPRPLAPPSIRATGEAVVSATPDRAQIDIGVVTRAATAQAAVEENARQADATIRRMRELLGPDAEVRTTGYSVQPDYRQPREGAEPAITGYTATNMVQVTINDLALTGRLIDAAASAGANRMQALRFMIRDDTELRAEALRRAAQAARRKAEVLAAALGLRIARVLIVEEGGQVSVPFRDMAYTSVGAATPIEGGTIEIRASVSIAVEIAP